MKRLSLLRTFVIAILLIALMLSFGACSPSSSTATGSQKPLTANSGKLIMATNATFPPYEYFENNKIIGIDPDVAGAIAAKLGLTLEVTDMEFDSIIAAVQTGKADIGMAGMTILPERQINVDFSSIYATGKQVIIVKNDSTIASPDDLKGKIIGVQASTTGDIFITGDFGDSAVQRFNKGADAIQALLQGKVDAVVIDNEPAKVFVSQSQGLKILPTDYIVEDYAIAVAKTNPELLGKINDALSSLKQSGDLQKIIDKYIKAS